MPDHTIAENLTRLQNAKTAIASAITAKGGTVSSGDGLEDFASDIGTITNSYTAGDEGKVVSNGALVSQTSSSTTTNGTIDTTLINSLDVNVSGADEGIKMTIGARPLSKEFKSHVNWVAKTWIGLIDFEGQNVWTDGNNIYHTANSNTYVLDKSTSTWNLYTWSGDYKPVAGQHIWTDGTDIYYSYNQDHYVLDKSTSIWSTKTWNVPSGYSISTLDGLNIWTDGDNIYFSFSGANWVLDKLTSTWATKTWTGDTTFSGNDVWTDGDNIYLSHGASYYQKVLNKPTSTWNVKTWSGAPSSMYGNAMWTDGTRLFHSNGTSHYIYNKSSGAFSSFSFTTLSRILGKNIWTDGTYIYYSEGTSQFMIEQSNVPNYYPIQI